MAARVVQLARLILDIWWVRRASRSAIETRQRERLAALVAFARRQSRFYRRLYADVEFPRGEVDLTLLPPVTKSLLMAQFDDVVTDTAITRSEVDRFVRDPSLIGHRFEGRYAVWLTSGTTGEPGVFIQDDVALQLFDALPDRWLVPVMFRPASLRQVVRNDARGAEIAITGGHFAGASGTALMRRESTFLKDRIRLFSPKSTVQEIVAGLNEYQPAFVVGYATSLVELAAEQRAGRLKISPALVVPTAEPISTVDKRLLAQAFQCTVREMYGATEFFPIAVECGRGNLHANTDWVVLEPVDEQHCAVPAGVPSRTVLITNLGNRTQPLIRYDLGDSITLYDEPCACGSAFPVIEVEGRQGDVLYFASRSGALTPVFPLAIAAVVEDIPGVQRVQIIQAERAALRVRPDLAPGSDEVGTWRRVDEDLRTFLRGQGIDGVLVERDPTPPVRNPASGKYRHVWSEIPGG